MQKKPVEKMRVNSRKLRSAVIAHGFSVGEAAAYVGICRRQFNRYLANDLRVYTRTASKLSKLGSGLIYEERTGEIV